MKAWLLIASRVLIGTLLVVAGAMATQPPVESSPSVVQVTIGGDVRYDPERKRMVAQNNATHWTRGLYPRCEGDYLRIDVRPASIVAPWVSLSEDGAMARRDIQASVGSSSKSRLLIRFTRGGETVSCRETFVESPASNLWVVAVITRKAPGR